MSNENQQKCEIINVESVKKEETEQALVSHEGTGNEKDQESASISGSIFARQYSASEGGMDTDLHCPGCGEQINGSYLPIFRCPFCDIQIWRNDRGIITNYEQKHTCPECGHTFGELTEEAPTEFKRMCRTFEQKTEGVFMELDRIVNRIFY